MTNTYLKLVSNTNKKPEGQRMMEIKQSLSRPADEVSLFDCMELNEQVEVLRQKAQIELIVWRAFKKANPELIAQSQKSAVIITARIEAVKAVKAYLKRRSEASSFQSWYLEKTTPNTWSPSSSNDDSVV